MSELGAARKAWNEWERGDDDLTLTGYQLADAALAEAEAETKRAWAERDHYLEALQHRNTQLQKAEADLRTTQGVLEASMKRTVQAEAEQSRLADLERRWTERTRP